MNRMNRQLEYGLMALKILAHQRPGQRLSAKEICEQAGSPFDPTARVLQVMKSKGIIQGEQGAHGGYALLKDLSSLSFLEFSEALLGRTALTKCIHAKSDCEMSHNCNIISPIQTLNHRLEQFYSSLTLSELLHFEKEESKAIQGVL
ncbi:MAG: Rrf2 family transcriptional regulator [Bdellovibrionales bacterium]|nr:Rrf2 family transcriptional regulator [Bdellovibrionales bacterium]